jgi:hypothetical protein
VPENGTPGLMSGMWKRSMAKLVRHRVRGRDDRCEIRDS